MKVSTTDQQGDIGLYAVALKISQELRWIFRPQPLRDIGIDAHVEVVEDGESTDQLLAMQIKSGQSWFKETNEQGVVFRGDPQHLQYWTSYPFPVILVLYDDQANIAYWQAIKKETIIETDKGWKTTIPLNQTLDVHSKKTLKALCRSIIHADNFVILSLDDVSHAAAKRVVMQE